MLTSKEKSDTKRLPMMPIRDVVIFPYMMTPFVVGREQSVRALEEAMAGDKKIFLATQHDASIDDPKPDEIYTVGCIVNIVQSLKLQDGNIKVLVEGVERGKVVSVSADEGFLRVVLRTASYKVEPGPQLDALISRVTGLFDQYVKLSQNLNYEQMIAAIRVDDPGKLADTVGANLQLTIEEKQFLLLFDGELQVGAYRIGQLAGIVHADGGDHLLVVQVLAELHVLVEQSGDAADERVQLRAPVRPCSWPCATPRGGSLRRRKPRPLCRAPRLPPAP